MKLIKGHTHKIYDNGDGTITKELKSLDEELLSGFNGVRILNYVARCLSYTGDDKVIRVVKEKIEDLTEVGKTISCIQKHWDDSLFSTYELFDYINKFLLSDKKSFMYFRVPNKFIDYLHTTKHIKCTYMFNHLCQLVQELKDNNIYNIDWNVENFGLKHNHLALFELGGAKLKKKK